MNAPRFFRRAAAAAFAVALVGMGASEARADKVHTRDGRVIEGKVVRETDAEVVVEKRFGSLTIRRDDVVKIEYEMTSAERIQKGLAEAKTADACIALARDAEKENLPRDTIRGAFEKALSIDPMNDEAHEALGHTKHHGKWLATDEEFRDAGFVQVAGRWVPPEEAARAREAARDAMKEQAREAQAEYEAELRGVPWGRAHIIETDHYIIKCNSTRKVAERYAQFMEQIYKAYDKVFKGYARHHQGKSTIYIFRNINDFQEYGGGQPGVGGFYVPKSPNENTFPSRIISAYHGTFGTLGSTKEVLAHEGTHQFQHILMAGSDESFMARPAWWIEGLAVYFGDGYRMDKRGNLEIGLPRDRLMWIQRAIQANQFVPMSKFVIMPYRQFSGYGLSYPYAWSMTHYFLHRGSVTVDGKQVALEPVFKKFFEVVTSAPPERPLHMYGPYYLQELEKLLGFPIDKLTDDWKKYVLGLELEKLGEIAKDGETFRSGKLAFELKKPSGWEWREEDVQGQEAIRLECAGTTALVTVVAKGNMDNDTPEKMALQAEQSAGERLSSVYIEENRKIDVNGYEAFEIFYEGRETAPPNATREVKVRPNEQRYRHVVVATLKRSYELIMQADKDRFDENKAAFDALLKGFKILTVSED